MSSPTAAEFGTLPAVDLDNGILRLRVVPDLGGRVVSLVDLRTGREWLVQGAPPTRRELSAWRRESAVFGGREAFGWDECLPTVAPCLGPLEPFGPPLRDHGGQWARPTVIVAPPPGSDGELRLRWFDRRLPFHLDRSLRLDGARIEASYALMNASCDPLPTLWSMHALLDVEPGSRIELPPGTALCMTQGIGMELDSLRRGATVTWPVARGSADVDLSVIRDASVGLAAKLYADPAPPGPISVRTPDGARLAFQWSRDVAPAVGVWIDNGGWPTGAGLSQLAIEPTTSGHDDLQAAIRDRRARVLEAGERLTWEVSIAVEAARTVGAT